MKLAIFLQHYFPYGGLQRDAVRLTEAATEAGHDATLIVSTWEGTKPDGIAITEIKSGGSSNHSKASRFADACLTIIRSSQYDTSIGFSRVPGAPFYFCGDTCFLEKFQSSKPKISRILPRYQHFLSNEKRIFEKSANTHIFFLATPDIASYQKHYQLKDSRITVLPPWLRPAEKMTQSREMIRQQIFNELAIKNTDKLLLFVGSDYKRKGADKIIEALALLDESFHLAVCGKDNAAPLHKIANSLGLEHRVHIMGPRDDIPAWMTSADLLVHPASSEPAGMVLIEALTYALPVTCTQLCGYSTYIQDAGGTLLNDDCEPAEISQVVSKMHNDLPALRDQAIQWAKEPSRYCTASVILDTMNAALD